MFMTYSSALNFLKVSILTMGIGVGTLAAGLFGMNVGWLLCSYVELSLTPILAPS